MGWLSLLSGVVSLLSALWGQFFSDSATLSRWKIALARKQALQHAEADRLKAEYERIAKEPDLYGKALADKLHETARKLRHKP